MLGDPVGTGARISHRATLVDYDRATQVCLVFILSNIKSIRFTKQLPIDGACFVAGCIRAMLFELDTGADMMRSVQAATHPFDNPFREQLQLRDSREVWC